MEIIYLLLHCHHQNDSCMHACVLGISRSSCVFFVGDHSLDLQACIHVYTFV